MEGMKREKDREREEKNYLSSNNRLRILSTDLSFHPSFFAELFKVSLSSQPLVHILSQLASTMMPIREVLR